MIDLYSDEKTSFIESLYFDLTYPELKWILRQRGMKMYEFSYLTDMDLGTMRSQGIPAHAIEKLIELCKGEYSLPFLRLLYSRNIKLESTIST
jgi:hypothetical protein